MPGKYQAYAEYKDSGFEWLGIVPGSWISTRLKFEALINMGQSPNSDDCNQDGHGLPFLQRNAEFGVRSPSPKQYCDIPRKVANKGQLLFSVRAPVGALNIADQKYGIGRGLCAIANHEMIASDFLWWLISVVKSELNSVSTGSTFEAVSAEQVENVVFFRPSLNEQRQIASFLDHETAKIDTLIEKQQQLIKLLKEKRQAMISHAVTEGLNPHAPMRDSGVEWLSEVPEHWDVCKLKHIISSLESGVSVNAADIPAYGDELGVLKTSCVYTRSFRVEENKTVLKEEENRVKCPIRKGAIIISRMNTPELVGASALVEADETNIYLPDRLWQTVFASNIKLNPKFIAFFMMIKGFRNQISLAAEGASSSMQNIAKDDYLSINIALPDIAEQDEIVSHLENKLGGFQKLEERANKAIELIQERRTALITAAVTGKIDVRNWQAPEPLHSNKETHKETVA